MARPSGSHPAHRPRFGQATPAGACRRTARADSGRGIGESPTRLDQRFGLSSALRSYLAREVQDRPRRCPSPSATAAARPSVACSRAVPSWRRLVCRTAVRSAGSSPHTLLRKVVLPQPLGPTRTTISPAWTVKFMPLSATRQLAPESNREIPRLDQRG